MKLPKHYNNGTTLQSAQQWFYSYDSVHSLLSVSFNFLQLNHYITVQNMFRGMCTALTINLCRWPNWTIQTHNWSPFRSQSKAIQLCFTLIFTAAEKLKWLQSLTHNGEYIEFGSFWLWIYSKVRWWAHYFPFFMDSPVSQWSSEAITFLPLHSTW